MDAPEPVERLIETPTYGRVLLRPAAGEPPAGILLGFHGYAENADIHLPRLTAIPGADRWIIASVEALNRFYRGRTEETVASWMTRRNRELAIENNRRYIVNVLKEILGSRALTPELVPGTFTAKVPGTNSTVVSCGFSQGTAMALRTAGAVAAAGVIAVGGDVPPELLADGAPRLPPVLLIRGERDEWYTADKLAADVARLEARGVPVRSRTIAGGHEWTEEASREAGAFLERVRAGG
jgi:predicted esterase